MALFPCVACGFLVFEEPLGSYEICPICGWGNDHVQLRYPGSPIGANNVSLYGYQQTVVLPRLPRARSSERHSAHTGLASVRSGEARARAGEPQSGHFVAASEDDPPYYWESADPPTS